MYYKTECFREREREKGEREKKREQRQTVIMDPLREVHCVLLFSFCNDNFVNIDVPICAISSFSAINQ